MVLFKNYAYLVPYVQENEDSVFLKTIIPSRKATKKYLKEDNDKKNRLDAEEQEILDSFEKEEWISVLTSERKSEIEEVARNTFKNTKRINIRMSERDFERIQVKALEENIPYQVLIRSVIHKYLDGRFLERN